MSELLNLKGIGESSKKKLNLHGIYSIEDLINSFPTKYIKHEINSFSQAVLGEEISLFATVIKLPKLYYIRKRLTKLSLEIEVENKVITATIFNREFLMSSLQIGIQIVITGKFIHNYIQFHASDITLKANYIQGIIPIYHINSISDKSLHKWINEGLNEIKGSIYDPIPNFLLEKNTIVELSSFLQIIHNPISEKNVLDASKRIKYEELLLFALKIESFKRMNSRIFTKSKKYDLTIVKKFIDTLPFKLTNDQKQATNELFTDLKNQKQMNRLLQGDVGSGKTICAIIASLAVVSALEQVALMAPTEILAYQHYQTMKHYLDSFGVVIAFLSSSIKNESREEILKDLKSGKIDILIGTHALIQEEVVFKNLGFVIIDEQHRFGVNQRKILRQKGLTPDVLFMSATPIPRTLAITLFGDMDISSIKSLPLGRKQIKTKIVDFEHIDRVFQHVNQELSKGHQAYFIVPLIDENEKSSLISLEEFETIIKKNIDVSYQIGFLHGKMKNDEKSLNIDKFYSNKIQALVSTTVVEVGLNVSNATMMIVINASKFGLSQLHQLRGRVGRNDLQSYCYLIVDDLVKETNKLSILEKTSDGFEISEADLLQRGPGEVFGEEQTGIPKFKMANIIEDQALLELAIEDAKSLMSSSDLKAKKLINHTIKQIESYHLD
ncbi:MAG: ATP-dependent DNA helicase RecG [Firmicutes bacterium]|nr:ATP-dependent DNA helicase RecG [Bacillota bacterium]